MVLSENQINAVLKNSFDEESIRTGIASLMGIDWESALEGFRALNHQEIAQLRAI